MLPTFGDASEQINLEQLMDEAKVRRSQYLKENLRHLLSAIDRAIAVLRFVLRSGVSSGRVLKLATGDEVKAIPMAKTDAGTRKETGRPS